MGASKSWNSQGLSGLKWDCFTFLLYQGTRENLMMLSFTMGRACGMHEKSNCVMMEKPEGKTLLGRPTLRWENNIRMDGMA